MTRVTQLHNMKFTDQCPAIHPPSSVHATGLLTLQSHSLAPLTRQSPGPLPLMEPRDNHRSTVAVPETFHDNGHQRTTGT